MRLLSIASVSALLACVPGCGLIDPDITKVTFELPPRDYTFDATSLNLPAGNTTAVPCGAGQVVEDCCNPPAGLPMPNCATTPIVCEAGVCTARITVSQSSTMNLGQEVPVLNGASSFGNLTINQITYTIQENSLNVDLPAMVLTLAPDGVTDPNDPSAKKFGTVPPIPAGSTAPGRVTLEPDAPATFSAFAHDLSMPFNFIATTTVDVPSGSPVPSGRIVLSVTGSLSVSL